MNWKRIIGAGALVVAAVAVVLCVKKCADQQVNDVAKEVNKTLQVASDAVQDSRTTVENMKRELLGQERQIDSLKNVIVAYRDSVAGARGVARARGGNNAGAVVVRTGRAAPVRPARVAAQNATSKTSVRMHENAKNNKNIIVLADAARGDEIEIVLGSGAVNDGNIIVGGDKIFCAGRDTLGNIIDTLYVKTR